MSDIIANLQVLSQQNGCLLDLSAILNASICPKIDIKTQPSHQIQDGGDYICVTPTQEYQKRDAQCDSCYKVNPGVCKKNTVALDLELLVLLDLLNEAELEAYLQKLGLGNGNGNGSGTNGNGSGTNGNGSGGNGNGNGTGGNGNGSGGNGNGTGGNGNGSGGNGSGGNKTAMVDPLLSITAGEDNELANVNVGGKDGLLNLDVGKDGHLLALDLNGKPILTLKNKRADRKLLGVKVGGKTDKNSDIAVNVLTHDRRYNHPHAPRSYDDDHYLTYFQPICNKGFKQEHRDQAHSCQAADVNHCLAICHSQAALVSIGANVNVANDVAVQLCAAIEFDDATTGDNCRYFVAPESQPCEDSQLEPSDSCYTFFRN